MFRLIQSIRRFAPTAVAFGLILAVAWPADAQNLRKHRKKQKRPIELGTSGGNEEDFNTGFGPNICTSGTLGGLMKMEDGGETRYFILSSNSTIAKRNDGEEGVDQILQPGLANTACQVNVNNSVGTLSGFKKLKFGSGKNTVDAAIAETDPDMVKKSGKIIGIGQPSSEPKNPQVGMKVQKSAAGSGVTKGEVISINTTVNLTYLKSVTPPIKLVSVKFTKQVIVQTTAANKPFALAGDTGGLLLEDKKDCPAPTGLMIAADSTGAYGIANRIQEVVKAANKMKPKGDKTFAGCAADAAAQSFEAGVDQAEERALQKAMRAQNRVENRILALRGVNGIGVSMDEERRPVLMIFVSRENEELRGAIPARVNGVPTRIVVAGPFAAL